MRGKRYLPLRQMLNWIFSTITDIDGFVYNTLENTFHFPLWNPKFVKNYVSKRVEIHTSTFEI